jgi:SNF2 family DNA or RNA helicase
MAVSTVIIQLAYQNSTPVFVPNVADPECARIFGGMKQRKTGLWLFPAINPFASIVLNDMKIVFKDRMELSPMAAEHVALLEKEDKCRIEGTLPEGFEFVTQPFEHQKETIVRALYEPRTGILFDCGLGKTKTAIDTVRAARFVDKDPKVLIVVPPHLPLNWAREFETHAPGEFTVCTLLDENRKTLGWKERRHIYFGTRDNEPPEGSWSAIEFPDISYVSVPKAPREIVEMERAYLQEVQDETDGVSKARTRLRNALKLADLPYPPVARKLAPRPRPAKDYDVFVIPTSIMEGKEDVPLIMRSFPYTTIIFDESHGFRTPSSVRTKAALQLATRAYRRHIMTGTPSLGNPMHLYAQLGIIGDFLTGTWFDFRRQYVVLKPVSIKGNDFDQEVAYKNLNVLNELMTLVTARKRADDCLDLPDVHIIDYPVPASAGTKKLYNEMMKESEILEPVPGTREDGDGVIRAANAADRINKLFQVLGGFITDTGKNYALCDDCPFVMECVENGVRPYTAACKIEDHAPPKILTHTGFTEKLDAAVSLLDTILSESDSKVIVWCVYTEEINMLEEAIRGNGWDMVRVDGSTKDKVAAQDKFNLDPDCRIYVAQISTGVGITLTAANYTLYYGVSFDLSDYEQSRKRNERISQTRKVTVYHLTVPGSVTDYIFRSLRTKQEISDSLTDMIQCSLCERNEECMAAGVKPFDPACVYSTKGIKVRILPALLK